jgi:acyl carrier protein
MNNREKLKELLTDVFLLEPSEFRFDMLREDVESWDSLGVVSMALGIQETFGYHMKPEEAVAIKGFQEIVELLADKGIVFDE